MVARQLAHRHIVEYCQTGSVHTQHTHTLHPYFPSSFRKILALLLVILLLLDATILFAVLSLYLAQLWTAVLFAVAAILMVSSLCTEIKVDTNYSILFRICNNYMCISFCIA